MSAGGGRSRLTPYLVALPGGLWLAIFFVIPILVMLSLSLQSGNAEQGFRFTWEWSNYADAWEFYSTQFIRSIVYALIVTASWKFILNDQGILLGPLKEAGLLPQDFHILATSTAVIGGLTYNYLPFMVLPLYVALERIDPSLVEAAHDLFASRASAFRRVVFPLSLPGVFAGVLITFVPVASDFVNSGILGGTQTTMIGNVIQTVYLNNNDYPLASAMSFMLMAALLIGIFAYARALGTEQVMEVSQA
jgi:spermidine/putrescine transport system permease protein